jgi:four helix bundle protein
MKTNVKEDVLQSKAFDFAVRIVKMYRHLAEKKKEYVISKQVLRSGTSIGAAVFEAAYAQSKADFINKLSISLKEASETLYWLRLLRKTDYLTEKSHTSVYADCEEIVRILASSILTTKKSLRKV